MSFSEQLPSQDLAGDFAEVFAVRCGDDLERGVCLLRETYLHRTQIKGHRSGGLGGFASELTLQGVELQSVIRSVWRLAVLPSGDSRLRNSGAPRDLGLR